MTSLKGIILINPTEIILRIYQEVEQNNWQLLLENSDKHSELNSGADSIVEDLNTIIEEVAGIGVEEWEIYSKIIVPKVNNDVANALNQKVETLSIKKEREFIFTGLLRESVNKHKFII